MRGGRVVAAKPGPPKAGVPIDLTQLRPQDVEELIEQLGEVTVDVEDSTSTVRIFCE